MRTDDITAAAATREFASAKAGANRRAARAAATTVAAAPRRGRPPRLLFDTAMKLAGFENQKALADYFGADFGTVNRWRCGRRPVPGIVAAVFELKRNPKRRLAAGYVADLMVEAWKRGG